MNAIVVFILKYWVLIIVICVIALMMVIGFYAESNGLVKKEFNEKPPKKKNKRIEPLAKEDVQKIESPSENNDQIETPVVSDVEEESFSDLDFPDSSMESSEVQNNDDVKDEKNDEFVSLNDNISEQTNGIESTDESVDFDFESEPANNNVQVEVDAETTEEQIEEENFEEFEEYFDKVLPEQPIISDELKKYMDEFQLTPLSLSKEKKEVDTNIHLPEIKNKELDDDIWSF